MEAIATRTIKALSGSIAAVVGHPDFSLDYIALIAAFRFDDSPPRRRIQIANGGAIAISHDDRSRFEPPQK
jgi:hypothetical protein